MGKNLKVRERCAFGDYCASDSRTPLSTWALILKIREQDRRSKTIAGFCYILH